MGEAASPRGASAAPGTADVPPTAALLEAGTRVASSKSSTAEDDGGIDAVTCGRTESPKVRTSIIERGMPAPTLATAMAEEPSAAGRKHGVPGTTGQVISVNLTGVVSGKTATHAEAVGHPVPPPLHRPEGPPTPLPETISSLETTA